MNTHNGLGVLESHRLRLSEIAFFELSWTSIERAHIHQSDCSSFCVNNLLLYCVVYTCFRHKREAKSHANSGAKGRVGPKGHWLVPVGTQAEWRHLKSKQQ